MIHQARILEFQIAGNPAEGYLSVMEWSKQVPFAIARTFVTYDTPESVTRGRHAHHNTEMILLAIQGTISLETEDRYGNREHFELSAPSSGVYLPKLCWHTMRYSPGAVQLVLASTLYDRTDYIFQYEEFTRICQSFRSA